jgi:flagellar hook-associated protein 1 FlgK
VTISGSLSSAMSGLAAASRAADIVSSNIANAMTPGYGRREINLTARQAGSVGQGVQYSGVQRMANQIVITDRRSAEANLGNSSARAAFYRKIEGSIGVPDGSGSLSARIAAFDTAMISAASRPDSEARLLQIADTGRAVANHLASASKDIQTARSRADDQIGQDVKFINETLVRVSELNGTIRKVTGGGGDASALMDQRQRAIDAISSIIPLREIPREQGTVALVTASGGMLLDGAPAVLGFSPVGVISPEMTLSSGALSGLTLNGRAIPTGNSNSPIDGGSLAANFAVRDDLSVSAQSKLDAIARDLVSRFQDSAVDPSLTPGSAGMFTDGGAAFDPLNEIGLAGRLTLNALADPQQGGQLWRLRDGIGAAAPGPASDSTLLSAMQQALNDQREPASGDFMTGTKSFATLVSDYISTVSTQRLSAESETSFSQGKVDSLVMVELSEGVDTDAELQKLLLIEQAYTANARVMQIADEMLKTLIGL